jgi:hypothetical protein
MFSNLFKRDKKTKNARHTEDTFSLAEMNHDGKTFLLRFKENQLKFAESGKYSYQMGIAVPLHSNTNGFPSKEENEQLLNMETILEKDFGEEDTAIFVGTIMGGGMKEFVFYTGKPQKAAKIFEKLRNEIKHHELQYNVQEDPNWEVYRTYGPQDRR